MSKETKQTIGIALSAVAVVTGIWLHWVWVGGIAGLISMGFLISSWIAKK